MFYKTDRLDRPSYPTLIMLLLTELDEPEVYRLVGYPVPTSDGTSRRKLRWSRDDPCTH